MYTKSKFIDKYLDTPDADVYAVPDVVDVATDANSSASSENTSSSDVTNDTTPPTDLAAVELGENSSLVVGEDLLATASESSGDKANVNEDEMEMCDEVDLGDPIDEFEKGTSEYEDSDAEKKAKSKKA